MGLAIFMSGTDYGVRLPGASSLGRHGERPSRRLMQAKKNRARARFFFKLRPA